MAMNPGAETFTVNLKRESGEPWGFRLQGGADFTTPLSIQSVNGGSIAERWGLRAGDCVLQINSRPSDELEHEQAKQEIVASGNGVTLLIQRGMVKIWKPKVTPMSELAPQSVNLVPAHGVADSADTYIQKTSLAADKPEVHHIGSSYNRSARPFFGASSGGGTAPAAPSSVSSQYNTPMNVYSAQNASDAYNTQTGAAGQWQQPHGDAGQASSSSGIRSVKAPVFDPSQHETQQAQHMTCKACGSLIVGVFVRIKGEPLHPECFKCVRCGMNLKNQGYFTIAGQMYCESDAKQASQSGSGHAVPVYR